MLSAIKKFSISDHYSIGVLLFLFLYGLLLSGLVVGSGALAIPLLIGLLVAVIVLFNVEIGLYAYIIVSELLLVFAVSMEAYILLCLSWGLFILRTRPKIITSFQSRILLLFTAWIFFNSFILGSKGFATDLMNVSKLLVPISIFFIITTIIDTREKLYRFIYLLILTGFLSAVLGVLQLVFQTTIFPKIPTDPYSMILASGPTGDPVAFGTQTGFVLMMCFALFIGATNKKEKMILLAIICFQVFSLLASLNRSAILGILTFGMMMLVLNRKAGLKLFFFFILGILMLSMTNIMNVFLTQVRSIWTTISTQSGHFAGRLESTLAGLRLISDNPGVLVWGSGIDSYGTSIIPYIKPTMSTLSISNTNSFVVFLTELGIFGIACMLLFIGLSMVLFLQLQSEYRQKQDLALSYLSQGLFASIIGLLVISTANTIWFMNLFWINLALAQVLRNIGASDSDTYPLPLMPARTAKVIP